MLGCPLRRRLCLLARVFSLHLLLSLLLFLLLLWLLRLLFLPLFLLLLRLC